MVWYFNFCTLHLQTDLSVNTIRILLLGQLIFAMLVTCTLHVLSQIYPKQNIDESESNTSEEDPNLKQTVKDSLYGKGNIDSDQSTPNHLEESSTTFNKALGRQNQTQYNNLYTKNKRNKDIIEYERSMFISQDEIEKYTPNFLGHYSISLVGCIFYSPFLSQVIAGFAFLISMFICIIFASFAKRYLMLACIVLSYVVLIYLFSQIIVGIGLANFDDSNISCYYSHLWTEQ